MPLQECKKLIVASDSQLSISNRCGLLQMHRSVYYYKPESISSADMHLMELMDRLYTEDPTRVMRRYRRDLAVEAAGRYETFLFSNRIPLL